LYIGYCNLTDHPMFPAPVGPEIASIFTLNKSPETNDVVSVVFEQIVDVFTMEHVLAVSATFFRTVIFQDFPNPGARETTACKLLTVPVIGA